MREGGVERRGLGLGSGGGDERDGGMGLRPWGYALTWRVERRERLKMGFEKTEIGDEVQKGVWFSE